MATSVHSAQQALVATLVGSAAVAVADVVADSIVVEKARATATDAFATPTASTGPETHVQTRQKSKQTAVTLTKEEGEAEMDTSRGEEGTEGELQSLCWGAAAAGGLLSAYASGSLLETFPPETVFLLTALFPLLVSAMGLVIPEDRVLSLPSDAADADADEGQGSKLQARVRAQALELRNTLTNPAVYMPVLTIFLWRATPDPGSAMFFFGTRELGFQPEFLGKVVFNFFQFEFERLLFYLLTFLPACLLRGRTVTVNTPAYLRA